jgi:site-specific recombinase XerD
VSTELLVAGIELPEGIGPEGLPPAIAKAGRKAGKRFLEFFTVNIRNPNTRAAYYRAALSFFAWCEARGLADLTRIDPMHVAAYIEELGQQRSKPTAKQHLAAVRMLFDWLVLGQVVPSNPAHSVRGPRHVVQVGKTPILTAEEARLLLDSIDTEHTVGLRDRALISILLYAFARVEATVAMNVEDYYPQGKRWWFRLHEKGGKEHKMPAHHKAEEFMDEYIQALGSVLDKKSPLFRSTVRRTKQLTDRRMTRKDAYEMVRRRARDAGIETQIGCHTFRATGITNYLENGGTLEKAQQMAAHSSAKTTKLYDRRNDQVTLDEVERVSI